jgi:(R,R)-butanediol dehydrogenase/meso-butanediol dehydrogenase/diacetyl reductase
MKAAIFKGVGLPLAVEEIADPVPQAGEVIISVGRCGVCGTDLHTTAGRGYPILPGAQLGHEYAGEVIALGKGVTGFKIGDKLAAMPQVGCGRCDGCRSGIDCLCSTWTDYMKGLAQYARVSAHGASKLPKAMSLGDGALVEPLAVAHRAVRLAAPSPNARTLVIGSGPIGLAALFWLSGTGVCKKVVLATTNRRRILAERLGADCFVVDAADTAERIRESLGGSPDIVFECAGTTGAVARSIELVKPQGMVMALGFSTLPEPIIPALAVLKDVSLRFSLLYTREDYAACVVALDVDGDRARVMVTDTVSMTDLPTAFEQLREGAGGGGKMLVDPWS